VALGPGSRLLLDKFVYDPQKGSGTIVLNLVKGAFRFVTGIASKPSYLIRVPNASITVRGTIFDIYIQENNVVWLLCTKAPCRPATIAVNAGYSTSRAGSSAFRRRLRGSTEPVDIIARPSEHRLRHAFLSL